MPTVHPGRRRSGSRTSTTTRSCGCRGRTRATRRNIAARGEIAIVIFDSTVSPDRRNAVYVEAVAAIVSDEELADAVAVYAARCGRPRAGDAGTGRSQRRRALAFVSCSRIRGVCTRGRPRSSCRRASRVLNTRSRRRAPPSPSSTAHHAPNATARVRSPGGVSRPFVAISSLLRSVVGRLRVRNS